MKTKTGTIIAIAVCAIFGMSSMNSFAAEKKVINSDQKMETVSEQSDLAGECALNVLENITTQEADAFVERYAAKQISLVQAAKEADFLKSAEQITAAGADTEIEKYAGMQLLVLKAKTTK